MKNPKVTIVIPVYNGGNFLKEAIESALSQTYANIEVIVVNDGSHDNGETEKIALSFGDKIRYYRKENGGVATALNLAISEMSGEYFSWLSHDDLYQNNKIEVQIKEVVSRGKKNAIVYSDYEAYDVDTKTSFYSDLANRYTRVQLEKGAFCVWMGIIHGCSLLIHRSHFDRIGLFDEKLRTTQDYDMWFRMFHEQELIFIPQRLMIGRKHADQGSRTIPEHLKERVDLYLHNMKIESVEEMKRVFGSEYHFYSAMLSRFHRWELTECYRYVTERISNIEQPRNLSIDLDIFKEYLFGLFPNKITDLYIFGAGHNGKCLGYDLLTRNISVKAFVDNDKTKRGSFIFSVPCIMIEEIADKESGIIISVEQEKDILAQLKKNGFVNVLTTKEFAMQLYQTPCKKAEKR